MQTRHWIFSDLQFAQTKNNETALVAAVDDMCETGLPLDSVWLLGDIAYGVDAKKLERAAQIIPRQLERLGCPVYYVMGNHEMDFLRVTGQVSFPLHAQALVNPQWHVAEIDSFYFTEIFGNTLVVFMGDHAAKDGSWFVSHGGVPKINSYPYSLEDYETLRRKISAYEGPVVVASHYALSGNQRPSPLLHYLLPLPKNVRAHLHGHAHIGDLVWNKENPWLRKNHIEGSNYHQFNISALEPERSPGSHSAILTLGTDGPIRLRIRCSKKKQWIEEFLLPASSKTL